MKDFFEEFRKFALRGNVVDMAVGIIIGAAFTTVINSLVNDIIMPPIGLLVGRVDFLDLFWVLKPGESLPPYASLQAAQEAGAVTINYGLFINNLLIFLITAFAVFLMIRSMNKLEDGLQKEQAEEDQPEKTDQDCPFCYTQISIQATRCSSRAMRVNQILRLLVHLSLVVTQEYGLQEICLLAQLRYA